MKEKSMVANRKNKPKMTRFSQKHAQYAFRSKLKQKLPYNLKKKQSEKQKSAKNKHNFS